MDVLIHNDKPYACKIAIKDCKKGTQYHMLGDNGVAVATWRFPKGQSPFKDKVEDVVKLKGKGNVDKCLLEMSGGFSIVSKDEKGEVIGESIVLAREMFVILSGSHIFTALDNDTKAVEITSF